MHYLDNIIIFQAKEDEYLQHLKIVFDRLKHADLKIKAFEMYLLKKEIHCLGNISNLKVTSLYLTLASITESK